MTDIVQRLGVAKVRLRSLHIVVSFEISPGG